ncbi:Uncharacterised protein [Vibrio cholerae]|nr:Uncharacterised protein [Vibrio cholerae]
MPAFRITSISACAVASWFVIEPFQPSAMISPSRTNTAPTGTSPCASAWAANTMARRINCSS